MRGYVHEYWHVSGISPAGYTRRSLMDLGFTGLLEKIEEYFGKTTSKCVVAFFLVFFIIVSIDLIHESILKFSRLFTSPELTEELIFSYTISVLTVIVILGVTHLIMHLMTNRHIKNMRVARESAEDALKELTKEREEVVSLIKSCKNMLTEIKKSKK